MSADDPLAQGSRAGSSGALESVARLRVVHPTDLQWVEPLTRKTVVIGRMEASGVAMVLTHGTVSRRHVELSWDDATGQHVGRDLDSHNGSRLDGEDIGPVNVALQHGSILQLGDVCLVYEQLPSDVVNTPPCAPDEPIPGDSPAMIAVRRTMARLATEPSPVLIHGPAGTGKEHLAKELHRQGQRTGPMVTVDCSDRNEHAVESQLFGHVRGAFDGADQDARGLLRAASGGTVILDEVGDLPLSIQPKLLRALVDGEARPVGGTEPYPLDVRVIATTRANLQLRVDAGGFDERLHALLAQTVLDVPPLRERRGDLMTWLHRLHARWVSRHPEADAGTMTLSAEAAETVLMHEWPRNLRDLERMVDELMTGPRTRRPLPRMRLPSWLRNSDLLTSDGRVTAEVGPPIIPRPEPPREELVAVHRRFDGNLRAMARHFLTDLGTMKRWLEANDLGPRPSAED